MLIEVLTAALFALSYLFYGLTIEAILFCALFMFLILITFYDLEHLIVPDVFSIPWNTTAFVLIVVEGNALMLSAPHVLNHLLSGVGLFLFFSAIWWMTKGRGMGFGDGIIALGIGFVLGFPHSITALLLSFWIGAIVSLTLIALSTIPAKVGTRRLFGRRRGFTMKSEVPFGPYLALGFLITLFFNVSLFF